MNCVIHVEGREAVPVRAIPFVTGWQSFSPDEVAEGLAHRLESGKLEGLTAYHIANDGSVSAMLPKEWDVIVLGLAALSKELREQDGSYLLWRERSIRVLPSHCFVWRDDLEDSFASWERRLSRVTERPGDKELNFAPRIPPNLEDAVFEGMPKLIQAELHNDAVLTPRAVPRDSSVLLTLAALLAAWPGGASAIPSGKDLERAAQALGLAVSDDTIRKALKAAQESAPSLPPPK